MGRHQLELFCTESDFTAVVDAVTAQAPVFFALAGSTDSPAIRHLRGTADMSASMSIADETAVSFLAVTGTEDFAVREVAQRKGGARYILDQLSNPRSVVLRPGLRVDEHTLLSGQIGTASDDPASLELFSAFSKVVRKQFVKVKS